MNVFKPFDRTGALIRTFVPDTQLNILDSTGYLTNRAERLRGKPFVSPTLPCVKRFDINELYSDYCAYRSKSDRMGKFGDLYQYEDELWESKVAPQGGLPDRGLLEKGLLRYYDDPERKVQLSPELRGTVDLLRSMLKVWKLSRPLGDPNFVLHGGPEAAGAPYFGKKADAAELEFASTAWTYQPEIFPCVAGWRFQRNKPRNIFMESFYGVAALSPWLDLIRYWAREVSPWFASWLNPNAVLNPSITMGLQHGLTWFEGDYTAMDCNLTLSAVEEIVFPLWEILLTPGDFRHVTDYIRRLYSAPLIFGNEIWTGSHTTFSGQGITNDIETWLSLVVQVTLLIHFKPSTYTVLAMLGDDLLLGGELQTSADDIKQHFLDICSTLRMSANLDKLRISTNPRYLRRTYFPFGYRHDGSVIGAYPLSFTLNSIFNPEYVVEGAQSVVSILQICDNLVGHPHWDWLVLRLFTQYVDCGGLMWQKAHCERRNWWEKLYGEKWNPKSSATAMQVLAQNLPCARTLYNLIMSMPE